MKASRCCSVCFAPVFQATILFGRCRNIREVQEHTEVNIIVDLTVQVCRVELTRVCVFKHTYHALFLKTSSTENIVFVIVKNKLTAFFHCLYFY